MNKIDVLYFVALFSGVILGALLRGFLGKRSIVVPPPSGVKAPYEVRLDGRVLYSGWDLADAKRTYYNDDHPRGVIELYSHGNHTASRKVKWL